MSIEPRRVETAAETAIAARLAGRDAAPAPLAAQRIAAGALLADGLPSRRVEAYRYTDLRAGMRDLAPPAPAVGPAEAAAALAAAWDWPGVAPKRLVFVDGRFVPALSDLATLDGAVTVVQLAPLVAAGDARLEAVGRLAASIADPVLALNTAFWDDGVMIAVAPGVTVAEPLAIVHLSTAAAPQSTFVRHVVSIGEGATARILEQHAGPAGVAYQSNVAIELAVGAGARLAWVRLQEEGAQALHLSTLVAHTGTGTTLEHLTVTVGAALSRQQAFVHFGGPDARLALHTATHMDGRRHADHTLVVDHAVPDCASTERFRSVVADDARSVVQGRINVWPRAQHTDARMMTQAILTGDGAEAINKPELEIFADDVQCGHGATCGRLDDDQLFYLRARGIPADEAEAMLLEAFLAETIEGIDDAPVVEALKGRLAAALGRTGDRP